MQSEGAFSCTAVSQLHFLSNNAHEEIVFQLKVNVQIEVTSTQSHAFFWRVFFLIFSPQFKKNEQYSCGTVLLFSSFTDGLALPPCPIRLKEVQQPSTCLTFFEKCEKRREKCNSCTYFILSKTRGKIWS